MKIKTVFLSLTLLWPGSVVYSADAGSPAKEPTSEIELLRRLLEAQKKNPNKVIHHPNEVVTAQANPPAKPTPAPPTGRPPAAKPVAPPANPPPAQPALQPVSTPIVSTYTMPTSFPSYEELEEAYLNRKISAKRFEEALKLLEKHQKVSEERKAALNKMLQEHGLHAPGSAAEQKKISDAEGKVDELMRLKTQRDQATNGTTATGPLTKRQRLDALLRQVIDGKMTETEYREQRDKIIAEPD